MFCDWCRPIPVISSTSQLTENEPDFLPVGFVLAESWRYAAGTLDGRMQWARQRARRLVVTSGEGWIE